MNTWLKKALLVYLVVFCTGCRAATVSCSCGPPIKVIMNVSAYCLCEKCCGTWATKGINTKGQRITASGATAVGFFVAAPPEYPFGTLMFIDGYNNGLPVPVLDRGGSIKGNKLDVFFPTHQEALVWGRKELNVTIY